MQGTPLFPERNRLVTMVEGAHPRTHCESQLRALFPSLPRRTNLSCKVDFREINSLNLLAVEYTCSTGPRPGPGRGPQPTWRRNFLKYLSRAPYVQSERIENRFKPRDERGDIARAMVTVAAAPDLNHAYLPNRTAETFHHLSNQPRIASLWSHRKTPFPIPRA